MSKQTNNDQNLSLGHEILSHPMTLIYVVEANVLILKCSCCNKMVAYCCDCNPSLEKLNTETSLQPHFTTKPLNNVITPMFEGLSIKNFERSDINSKKTDAIPESNSLKEINLPINKTSIVAKENDPTNNLLANKLSEKTKPSNSQPLTNKNSILQSQSEIMEFCYRIETKMGEINLGANYYQILELGYKASNLEIQESSIYLLDEFSIDKIIDPSIAKDSLKTQINIIRDNISIATTTLLNNSLRENYDTTIFKYLASKPIGEEVIYSQSISKQSEKEHKNISKPSGKKSDNLSLEPSQSKLLFKIEPSKLPTPSLPSSPSSPLEKNINQKSNISLPPKLTKPVPEFQKTVSSIATTNTSSNIIEDKENKNNFEQNKEKAFLNLETNLDSNNLNLEQIKQSNKPEVINETTLIKAKPANKISKQNINITGYAIKKEQFNYTKKEIPIAKDLYNLSSKCFETSNYERALTTLQKALELDPNNALYWNQLGKIYSKMNNLKHRAENAFTEAIKLDSNNLDYLTDLAILFEDLGKIDQAAKIFQKIFQLKCKESNFYRKIQSIFLKVKNYFQNRRESSLERKAKAKEQYSKNYQQFINFIKLLFRVINYKLIRHKNK